MRFLRSFNFERDSIISLINRCKQIEKRSYVEVSVGEIGKGGMTRIRNFEASSLKQYISLNNESVNSTEVTVKIGTDLGIIIDQFLLEKEAIIILRPLI